MQECQLENITVFYQTIGAGTPLLILPGWTASPSWAAFYFEPLLPSAKGYRRIYLDLPGHGKTPSPAWIESLDDFLAVVRNFIESVLGEQRFILAGHSLGAYLARGVLKTHARQIDGLLMMVPAIKTNAAERDVPQPSVLVEDPGFQSGLTDEEMESAALLTIRNRRSKSWLQQFPKDPPDASGDPEFLETLRTAPSRYTFSFDVDARLPPFEKPTLIVTGRQDFVTGYQDAWALLENYPRATFVVLDRAGHFLEDKNDVLQSLVSEWLQAIREDNPE